MKSTLKQQLAESETARRIALNDLRAAQLRKMMDFTNKNLQPSKKRKKGWTIPGPAERDMNNYDRRAAMANARQLVEETTIGNVLLNAHLDFCVGPELYLSMRSKDEGFNTEVENRWNEAKDTLDIRGIRHWGKLNRMWQARNRVDGDLGIALVDGGDRPGGGRISLLQTIEGDRIWHDPTKPNDCGIDFDSCLRPKTFYVGPHLGTITTRRGNIDARYKARPIDAAHFVFYPHFPQERAERMRGVSAFTCLLDLLKDLEETDEGMSQKIKNAAFIGLLWRQLQATTGGSLLSEVDDDLIASEAEAEEADEHRHVKMQPGINIHAEDGQTVEVLESQSPSSEYMAYLRHRLRIAGLPFGLPLEFLLLDPSAANYAGLMMTGQAMKRRMLPIQADLRAIASRVFRWWLAREVEFNGLKVPASLSGSHSAHRWIIPTGGLIDPKKETDAWQTKINARLTTRQRAMEEMGEGGDFEDVIDEIAREERYMDDKNVTYQVGDPGASVANDPNAEPKE